MRGERDGRVPGQQSAARLRLSSAGARRCTSIRRSEDPDLGALRAAMGDGDEELAALGHEQAGACALRGGDARRAREGVLLLDEHVDEPLPAGRQDALMRRVVEEVVDIAGELESTGSLSA